jgi:hypothetical protein
MKKLVTAFVLVTVLGAPAFAKPRHQATPSQGPTAQAEVAQAYAPGNQIQPGIDSQTVVQDGRVLGRDPDPQVRQRILLDGDMISLSD